MFITKPISGIVIEGQEFDLRPKEPLAGTYEAPTEMNFEIKVQDAPAPAKQVAVKGKCISGRVWSDPEERTSNKHSLYRPDDKEKVYRRARTLQLREFLKERKAEIEAKVTRAKEQRRESKKRKEANQLKGQTYQVVSSCLDLGQRHQETQEVVQEGPQITHEDAKGHVRGASEDNEAKT